jgi:hypothetical protein
MQIHIGSKHLVADIAVALDVTGREHLMVVAKATWTIPQPGQRPKPMKPQPLVMADEYYGEPGDSALRCGADYARHKPMCDVLFEACAHSPEGKPLRELNVAWQVGPLKKSLRVLGPRRWMRALGINKLTEPEPFVRVPLHYGLAFGGTRAYRNGNGPDEETLSEAYLPNPAGLGFAGKHTMADIHDALAPQLEAVDDAIRSPNGKHAAAAFSPIAVSMEGRSRYAGTYDDAWERDVSPFLPEDFDDRFHQCAPPDQQMPYPRGGEEVTLLHMMRSRPQVKFTLPLLNRLTVRVLRTDYSTETLPAAVDTLFFETEAERFSAVWRVSTPLRRRLEEIDTLAIGPVDPQWWRARSLGLEADGDCQGCGGPSDAMFEEAH